LPFWQTIHPELLSWLQGIVDEHPRMGRFVLTSSAQFDLIAGMSQSLAGPSLRLVRDLKWSTNGTRRRIDVPSRRPRKSAVAARLYRAAFSD
jgi:hypothetical protein